MIRVYCVLLNGEPFFLDRDGERKEFGFYRNEYALSSSPEKAAKTAKIKALRKLGRCSAEMIEGRPIELKVEKIDSGMPVSRLFRNEGFIFYPLDL